MELQALKLYLSSRYGMDRVDALFWEVQMIMVRALIAVQPIMINDRHCFEMYGYDIMIDQDLKPWLLEVNASPSLTANTREDYLMKTEMLHGMLDVVDMEQVLNGDEEHVSGWDVVYDNGYIEIDPEQCGYSTFLGTAIPESVSRKTAEEEKPDRGGVASAAPDHDGEEEET
jgi:tubulin polyglutamylase TTLL9